MMKKLNEYPLYKKAMRIYKRVTSKKYSTMAGTLVFFMLLSIIPFIYITSLLFSSFSISYEWLIKLGIFDSYRKVLELLLQTVESASKSASLFFVLSAVYSSTNFFYHMRRSGEIIYNYKRKKSGVLIRLSSTVLVVLIMLGSIAIGGVLFFLSGIFEQILPSPLYRAAIYAALAALCFAAIVILNLYICPYRNELKNTLKGSVFTLVFWAVSSVGLALYAKYAAGMQRLYGAIAFVMVFLFWLYFIMQGLLIGVIINMKETKMCEEKKY